VCQREKGQHVVAAAVRLPNTLEMGGFRAGSGIQERTSSQDAPALVRYLCARIVQGSEQAASHSILRSPP